MIILIEAQHLIDTHSRSATNIVRPTKGCTTMGKFISNALILMILMKRQNPRDISIHLPTAYVQITASL